MEAKRLDLQLGERDRVITRLVVQLNVMSGAQLRRVAFASDGHRRDDAQTARRVLLRLTKLGVLARLERRIGGIKRGSEGFVYRLGPAGQRLADLWSDNPSSRTRHRPEPGARFISHRLAVSELCVRLIEASRAPGENALELLDFQVEPDSWRPFVGPHGTRTLLKPDAFVRLAIGDRELWWFVEADLGSVSQRTRSDQAAAYRAYWRSGAAGDVMPRVLWGTTDATIGERAKAALRLDQAPAGLFVVTELDRAVVPLTEAST